MKVILQFLLIYVSIAQTEREKDHALQCDALLLYVF